METTPVLDAKRECSRESLKELLLSPRVRSEINVPQRGRLRRRARESARRDVRTR
jgi:hypothetical protein